jgi:hypothetical protein
MKEQLMQALVWLLWQSNIWGGLLAIRLVKWTGKSPRPVHPKHFLGTEWRNWYVPFLRAGDAALDVGCNNAMHTMEAARRVAHVDGFDYSARHLATRGFLVLRRRLL